MPQGAKRVFVRRRGVHRMDALTSLPPHKIVFIIIIVHQHNILLSASVCVRVWGVEYFQIFNRLPRTARGNKTFILVLTNSNF